MAHISFNDKDALENAIKNRYSFTVYEAGSQSKAVEWLERTIENNGMSCRIYSGYRKTVLAGALIPTGLTQATALLGGIAMLAHNIATFNPDYEICKDVVGNGIEVSFKK